MVSRVDCFARVPPGGHGTLADVFLANHWFRAVLRGSVDALTRRGVDGLTVIDAAPWGQHDVLHEAIPLVDGAWLDIEAVTLEPQGVQIVGPRADGERTEVRYLVDAHGPWLTVEGADGFDLHVAGDAETWGDGAFLVHHALIASDGGAVTDLGGAVQILGAHRLLVADASDGWTARTGAGIHTMGSAPGASHLAWWEGEHRRGRTPIASDGTFDLVLPATTTGIRAEAEGRAPSAVVAPGDQLALTIGAQATLQLSFTGLDRASDLQVAWRADDGRENTFLVRSSGATLALGAGIHHLELLGGPSVRPTSLDVRLGALETRAITVALEPLFERGSWVRAGFDRPSDRSRTFRGSDGTAARLALGEGYQYAVFAPLDVIPAVTRAPATPVPGEPPVPPRLAFQNGTQLTGEGWSVSGWPWAEHPTRALYGGIQTTLVDPLDAAAAVHGGVGSGRALRVDLGWLSRAGPPFLVEPRPDFVALESPEPDLANWTPWFTWLDAGRAVVPTGPVTWVRVIDPTSVAPVDVEQPLFRGHVAAGSGPLLELLVDGAPPGQVVLHQTAHTVRWRLGAADPLDVSLIGAGGTVLAELTSPERELELPEGWVIALARSPSAPETWAVTGPVWLVP